MAVQGLADGRYAYVLTAQAVCSVETSKVFRSVSEMLDITPV
jgi:hypothetical protein